MRGRHLGIDFGERRIGIAISDPAARFALPLTVLERRDDRQAAQAIGALARREEVVALVLGDPRRLDGSAGEASLRVRAFARRLRRATGLPVRMVPEALTSRAAAWQLEGLPGQHSSRRRPDDARAAQILLQDALEASGGLD